MQWGYFDDTKKEYVITQPDTPTPWSNYLGDMEYGAIITNNAAGYSFSGSSAEGKILRFRFNACYVNMPGRYIYVKDAELQDYWSASWQPVGKSLDEYNTVCRHGIGYTEIISQYKGIETSSLYYVPVGKHYEVWKFKIKNLDSHIRKLSVFSYAEFTNHNVESTDMENIQFSQYISRTYCKNNSIVQAISEENEEQCWRFFGLSRATCAGWDTSREAFIGIYGTYSNPVAVQNGKCNNSLNYTGNACGTFQIDLEIEPGEEREIIFTLGEGDYEKSQQLVSKYSQVGIVDDEISELKGYWNSKLEVFQIKTPDVNFNRMINLWHSYECFINTFWCRTASLIYTNIRNGFGYRDTIADAQSIMHLDCQLAKQRLVILLSGQVSNGGALPLVGFDHKAGEEVLPDTAEYHHKTGYGSYRCDDTLWLFPAVRQLINESGDIDFLNEVIPFSDHGNGTVYEHLKRALVFLVTKLGSHNLLVGLENDWNDCLKLGNQGESVFASFQLYLALDIFKTYALHKNLHEDVQWVERNQQSLYESLQKYCWQEDQFIRAITADGHIIGAKDDAEASLWLNPQVWAVISGVSTPEQTQKSLDKVYRILKTKYGAMLFYPSYQKLGLKETVMTLYMPGIKENASIFLMAEAWIIQAEAMAGHGNRAWEYYQITNPANYNNMGEIHRSEPYVYSQFVDGKESPHFGRAHGHWLTGAASSIMLSVVEWILGIRAEYDGIIIDPCIPKEWRDFTIVRVFRGKTLNITIKNPEGVEKGIKKIIINSEVITNSSMVPLSKMKQINEVEVIMGK